MTTPPSIARWNLALRFALEIAALVGLALGGWSLADEPLSWLLAIGLPVVAAAAWGVFNVPGDPSRSGRAPVRVPGAARLAIEALVLGAGAAGLALAGLASLTVVLVVLAVVHYATTVACIRWLLAH